ncbi:hypothetical protein [Evansella halocellulosilytica]|uniref:hypothetical protein n=1 Tax=Evansella halocellulosilytica TaxID=2011013 RepID=UPI000BB85519|nr:hypothetical protein [Evansella halocellulosilytica]
MPVMTQNVAYCPVDGSSFKVILEEEEAALAPAVTRRRKTVLLRLLVADFVLLSLQDQSKKRMRRSRS